MKRPGSKPLLACIASQLLKDNHPKLGLMQRSLSVLLYGNGVNKHVSKNSILFPVTTNFYILGVQLLEKTEYLLVLQWNA